MRYRKPEELKETDVEWIEEIPRNWDFERLKSTVKFCQNGIWGDNPEGDETDIPCIRVADFDRFLLEIPDQDFTMRSVPKDKREGKVLKKGDLILEKSGGGDNQPVGAVMLYDLDIDAVCSNFTARMPVKKNYNSSFLRYVHYHLYHGRVNTRSIKQTTGIQNLDSSQYLNEKVGLPSLSEQRSIATFLDHKTEAIDQLIQKKEQLIERLKEKRQSLITRAVTKGLDPDVPLKDSGIEWLGEIPEHWVTKDLKFIAEVHSSNVDKKSNEDEETVELCNYTDVYYNEFITNDLEFMKATAPDSKFDRFQLEEGDVIITKDSEDQNDIAVPALVKETKENLLCGYHLALIKCKKYILGEFLFRLFQSKKYREEFGNRSNGITRYGLGVHEIKNIEIALPSLDRQQEIIESLNNQIKQIDNIISETRKSIPKLNEYRQSLISAAVTGKIDVRNEVEVESKEMIA